MRLILTLILLAAPLAAQFTSAHSIWGRPITPTAPTDGYAITWSASQGKFIFSLAAVSVSWAAAIGFDGGGVALTSADTSCVYVAAAVNMATVKLRSECSGGTSCTGSASVAVTTGTMASYISSGMAGITTAACTAALSAAYGSSTACVAAIPADSVVCFAGSGFATSVRVKVDAVGVYQ